MIIFSSFNKLFIKNVYYLDEKLKIHQRPFIKTMKIKIATKFIQTKLINNYYYIVNMSASANKNRDIVGENETLFDFLKRKKKYNL